MAKYRTVKGSRTIVAQNDTGWAPEDEVGVKVYTRAAGGYRLEKRRLGEWRLYSDNADGFNGEPCGKRVLEAVEEAEAIIIRAEAPQHEVTASLEQADAEAWDDAWDEPRAELEPAEVMTLRPGLVVEARLAPSGARVRVRLAAAPRNPSPGIVTLTGADDAEHDVDATSVVLIGVMPRRGDTIHAQAKTYTEAKTAAELPDGARVRANAGEHEGRSGKVIAAWAGRVDRPGHPNHGREYVGVQFDAVPGDGGANRHFRPFVDELRLVDLSKPMRRKLDRDPWAGNPGQIVVSDGRGVDAVQLSTVVILAGVPGKRTDEQKIARAVSIALPGLDFHTNTTSTSAIRVYAKKLEGEGRDDEAVLARNDDIAEAIALAGFYVSRRGIGQPVYASVTGRGGSVPSASPADPCELESHVGEPAPWIAVLPSAIPLGPTPYVCRDCIRRHVEAERAIDHIDPERPYVVRMWDEAGRTLKAADDPQALDFAAAETESAARQLVAVMPEIAWRDGEQVRVHRTTLDFAKFSRDGDILRVSRVLTTGLGTIEATA